MWGDVGIPQQAGLDTTSLDKQGNRRRTTMTWPDGFIRIPRDDPWATCPVEELARKYDAVENHGWYRNLEPTLDELASVVVDGDIVIDYSAGTGILAEHFLRRNASRQVGFVLVDASPKFLRLALDKLGTDERTAFRWIQYLKNQKRLQMLDEVLPPLLLETGAAALCSTNAIHLYYDLLDTLRAWGRVLKPGAAVLIQSGNINNPDAAAGTWIIDETVEQLQPIARELVRGNDKYAAFRASLDDAARLVAYDQLRRKYFLPVRPLSYYVDTLREAGFEIVNVEARSIDALVSDWTDFLSAYHEGVLGWAGGSRRIDDAAPSENAIRLRQDLLRDSLALLFEYASNFLANWTYITCRMPAAS